MTSGIVHAPHKRLDQSSTSPLTFQCVGTCSGSREYTASVARTATITSSDGIHLRIDPPEARRSCSSEETEKHNAGRELIPRCSESSCLQPPDVRRDLIDAVRKPEKIPIFFASDRNDGCSRPDCFAPRRGRGNVRQNARQVLHVLEKQTPVPPALRMLAVIVRSQVVVTAVWRNYADHLYCDSNRNQHQPGTGESRVRQPLPRDSREHRAQREYQKRQSRSEQPWSVRPASLPIGIDGKENQAHGDYRDAYE